MSLPYKDEDGDEEQGDVDNKFCDGKGFSIRAHIGNVGLVNLNMSEDKPDSQAKKKEEDKLNSLADGLAVWFAKGGLLKSPNIYLLS